MKFSLQSVDGCAEIEQYLDDQHKQLDLEVENLKGLIDSFQKSKKEMFDYLQSKEYWKELRLSEYRQTRLVIWLGQIAKITPRKSLVSDAREPVIFNLVFSPFFTLDSKVSPSQ